MAAIVRMNPNLEQQVLAMPSVRGRTERIAKQAKATAERTAPRDTGDYSRSFRLRHSGGRSGARSAWVLVNTDPAAAVIEYGARQGKNPKFRTMGRAALAMAGRR